MYRQCVVKEKVFKNRLIYKNTGNENKNYNNRSLLRGNASGKNKNVGERQFFKCQI